MLKNNDRAYSWHTHRTCKIVKIKWETAIVKWDDDGSEQLVPLEALRKFPTREAIYNELRYAYQSSIPFDRFLIVLEKEYGDKVADILDEVIEHFKVRTGDLFSDGRRTGRVLNTMENMAELEFGDLSRERIQKRSLILDWQKLIEED